MTTRTRWQWQPQDPAYGNYGNANQWTVNAGLTSLARESAQNSNDARQAGSPADLVFTFIRLTGERRSNFEDAIRWDGELMPHLEAMGSASAGAVAAGQLKAGLDSLRAAEALVLLRVADYGCQGLTGPEFTAGDQLEFGNFVKLCRLDLFSGKEEAAGGSFGLGKAVYWRFSRMQTVLFNSTVEAGRGVAGQTDDRLFGVQQGVVHRFDGKGYQGRGYFGSSAGAPGMVESVWSDMDLVESLHLRRADHRPGTSALILGFYDPDNPQSGLGGKGDLRKLASELRAGVEENFWPLLARGGLRVHIDIEDDCKSVSSEAVDGEETFTELVRALRKFDKGQISDSLEEAEAVVVRDVTIAIPAQKEPSAYPAFTHHAKLVVTLSDENADSLENKVCLFRKPEMVVETVDQTFDGRKYHAFLVAGAAIHPGSPDEDEMKADDFLRFAEPPSHDRWIPGSGRRQASQANLTGRYNAPWLPNLRGIDTAVRTALFELFGTPPPPPDSPPEAILRHLRFLRSEAGAGGAGGRATRKPTATIMSGKVEDGRWSVEFQVRAANRAEGWTLEPCLAFVGLDGGHEVVEWDGALEVVSIDGEMQGRQLILPNKANARVVKATLRGTTVRTLPIPASESAVEVVLRGLGLAPVSKESVV